MSKSNLKLPMVKNLFYGDNLDVLRRKIDSESVDLCYIDPPFNSKRNYNQIYNNIGNEDKAQAQAFTDTWTWDTYASEGFQQIIMNDGNRFTSQTIELMKGLQKVLKEGSLLAYLVHMTLRVVEIHRVLKPNGSFYLHCDPTASHYLKLVLDGVFCAQKGGDFVNEIIWCYKSGGSTNKYFARKHDIIFLYSKGKNFKFNATKEKSYMKPGSGKNPAQTYYSDEQGSYTLVNTKDWWQDIGMLSTDAKERLGYPTQKPESLLERIIKASSDQGDLILDAYCGCGTTIAVAERLKRNWIGIDITYQSISLILRRFEGQIGKEILKNITLNGIPQDMESARALANKRDDRLRKEFEKWAVLTYSENRAQINDKKGADSGIDGIAFFQISATDTAKMVFQVKSGGVQRGDIAKLRGDMAREGAEMGTLITLEPPTGPMRLEAKVAGFYLHPIMQKNYDRIQIVTIQDIIENGTRMELPMNLEVLKKAQPVLQTDQLDLGDAFAE